ncbi:MAG: hypothetical protein JNL21_01615 [Myxococcales bacterium]|nr:hypothetical protein [Myxococcales bacterium]
MLRLAPASLLASLVLACAPVEPPAAPVRRSTATETEPERDAEEPSGPEPCRVFALVREPTVRTTPVANVVVHGDKPGSLVTLVASDSKELMATTLEELETSICQRLEPKPYLLHLFKEKGTLVGALSTPIEKPDVARDARTVCGAERLGATILPGGAPGERRSIGLQQSAGGLTSPKYRALLFDVLHVRDEPSAMRLVTELDADIRDQGEAEWQACTLLVKK